MYVAYFFCKYQTQKRKNDPCRHAKSHASRVRLTHFHLTHAFPPAKILLHAFFFCEVIHNFVRRLSYSRKSIKLLPPDVRFYGKTAPNSISAGALPQTPLGVTVTALPQTFYSWCLLLPLPKIPTPVLDSSGIEPRLFDPAVLTHFPPALACL